MSEFTDNDNNHEFRYNPALQKTLENNMENLENFEKMIFQEGKLGQVWYFWCRCACLPYWVSRPVIFGRDSFGKQESVCENNAPTVDSQDRNLQHSSTPMHFCILVSRSALSIVVFALVYVAHPLCFPMYVVHIASICYRKLVFVLFPYCVHQLV